MFIRHKKWRKKHLPKKVLFIRLQALGDTAITMPYINGYKEKYPSIIIHFITREEVADITLFNPVIQHNYILKGGRKNWLQWVYLIWLLPRLIINRYDIVYDLQNNHKSSFIKWFLLPTAWSSLDRFSAAPAGKRMWHSIAAVGLSDFEPKFSKLKELQDQSHHFLNHNNLKKWKIIVNPAGFYPTRNWPHDYYLEWAQMMLQHFNWQISFIFLGVDRVVEKADAFEQKFPDHTINLVNKTTLKEAIGIVQQADFLLTEDSGLMHMAWTSGVPTLAIFGGSRSDWSRPLGKHTKLFHSADLPCGNCLRSTCIHEEVRCLTRYSPSIIFQASIKLIDKILCK